MTRHGHERHQTIGSCITTFRLYDKSNGVDGLKSQFPHVSRPGLVLRSCLTTHDRGFWAFMQDTPVWKAVL